jgi:hypothetical protein
MSAFVLVQSPVRRIYFRELELPEYEEHTVHNLVDIGLDTLYLNVHTPHIVSGTDTTTLRPNEDRVYVHMPHDKETHYISKYVYHTLTITVKTVNDYMQLQFGINADYTTHLGKVIYSEYQQIIQQVIEPIYARILIHKDHCEEKFAEIQHEFSGSRSTFI